MCILDKHTDTLTYPTPKKKKKPHTTANLGGRMRLMALARWGGAWAGCHCACERCSQAFPPTALRNSQAVPRAATRGRHEPACCLPFAGRVRDPPQRHLGNFNCAPAVFKRPHFCFSTNHAPHSWSKFRNTPGTCEYGGTGHLGPRGKERTPNIKGPQSRRAR